MTVLISIIVFVVAVNIIRKHTTVFFEEIIEAAMDDLRSVWLKAHIVEERVVFCIEVETSADLSGNTKVYSGGKTEEDVWRFTFAVGKEGAKE